jgi:hypothetical protein
LPISFQNHGQPHPPQTRRLTTDSNADLGEIIREIDEVDDYLPSIGPELQDPVLVIHTRNNGEISETASGQSEAELQILCKASNDIDPSASPYKAIVSVLQLKEGWEDPKAPSRTCAAVTRS